MIPMALSENVLLAKKRDNQNQGLRAGSVPVDAAGNVPPRLRFLLEVEKTPRHSAGVSDGVGLLPQSDTAETVL